MKIDEHDKSGKNGPITYSPEGASSLWNWDLWKSWKSDGEGGKDERRAKITNTDNGEAIDVKTYKREF